MSSIHVVNISNYRRVNFVYVLPGRNTLVCCAKSLILVCLPKHNVKFTHLQPEPQFNRILQGLNNVFQATLFDDVNIIVQHF